MAADQDPDILLGRLVVHYEFLTKERVSEAIRLWRATGGDKNLGEFLVAESYIPPNALPKLLKARDQYLQKLEAKTEPDEDEAAGGPAAGEPAAAIAARSQAVGAATVRLSAEEIAAARAARPEEDDAKPQTPQDEDDDALSFDSVPVDELSPSGDESPPAPDDTPATPDETPAAPVEAPAVSDPAPSGASDDDLLEYHRGATLVDLLRRAAELGASDLHIHSGAPLKVRLDGLLTDASGPIDSEDAERILHGQLDAEQTEVLEEQMQLDLAFSIEGIGRFRSNIYRQQRGLDGVFRIIPPTPPTLAELGLPDDLQRFSDYHQGIVLFTGPGGCGKSSTMAALVSLLNQKRPDHILTIEDPIEYVHEPAECVVNQREVGPHTESFARALRAALREDPDIIVIGELRDLETVSLALTAAETGHLVLATLHTASAIPTINRLIGVFPPEQQAQIRTMVSESLRVIISQRLVPRADGEGRVPALEILVNNKAIGNLIRENRTFQIKSILQTGAREGMTLLDASLTRLVKEGTITKEAAKEVAIDPKQFA